MPKTMDCCQSDSMLKLYCFSNIQNLISI